MVKVTIESVEFAWKDNGHKMWTVFYLREDTQERFALRTWARDEIDAYNIALKRLEGADQ